MQMELFQEPGKGKKQKDRLFCNKWTLDEAMAKLLDIRFQDNKKFQPLLSELYAHAINNESKELFSFLESRYNQNLIQDKEVNLIFEIQDKPVDERLTDGHKG